MEVFQNSVVTQKDFKTLKENWIRKQLLLRAREYTEYKKLSYVQSASTLALTHFLTIYLVHRCRTLPQHLCGHVERQRAAAHRVPHTVALARYSGPGSLRDWVRITVFDIK